RRVQGGGAICVPVFRDLDRRRVGRAHGGGQALAERASAIVLDHAHLVVADSIDPEFGQEKARIVDQEPGYKIVPVREDLPAGPSLVGKEKTVVEIAGGLPVVKPDAAIVEAAAGMVVDQ